MLTTGERKYTFILFYFHEFHGIPGSADFLKKAQNVANLAEKGIP
jgi:hypothetical protein